MPHASLAMGRRGPLARGPEAREECGEGGGEAALSSSSERMLRAPEQREGEGERKEMRVRGGGEDGTSVRIRCAHESESRRRCSSRALWIQLLLH